MSDDQTPAATRARAPIAEVQGAARAGSGRPEGRAPWRALLAGGPNILLEGSEAATGAILLSLMPHCAEPVGLWGEALAGPRPRTLIVREVSALSAAEQRRLLDWLATGDRVQVLSISSQPLYPLVARGRFLESLYYRLNVVRFEAGEGARLEDL
jgi:hypothetical protein